MMDELLELIKSNCDPRVLKRAIAVRMTLQGYTHAQIMEVLGVSSGFISKWKQHFVEEGVAGLALKYRGSAGFLSAQEREQLIQWLQQKNSWNINELERHIAEEFDVVFASRSSYYDLLEAAGISWKKSPGTHPRKEVENVQTKRSNN
jgi:putative transposase